MRSAKLVPLRRLFSASLVLSAWLGVWAGLFSSEAMADSWEQRAEGPGPRASHTAVWTGHEMIVWGGGVDGRFLNDGGRYNPEADVWRRTSPSNAPSARWFHAAVWTGTEMLIWGGRSSFDGVNHRRDGARYNPLTDRWTRISTNSAPAPRSQMAAVWTGTEMIVWGGFREGGGTLADGARYNPTTDTWAPMAPTPLEGRGEPTAVWTGTELIVFGGVQYQPTQRSFGDGARYDPATDTWNLLPVYGSPGSRTGHTAILLDGVMLIWGGRELPGDTFLNNGARYNYADDSWGPVTQEGAPEARMLHAAVWTGTEMIVWGGQNASSVQINTGSRYSLSTLEWTPTAQEGAPGRRMFWRPDLGIWTGKEMIVYGGSDYPTSLNSTFVYRPVGTNEPPPPPAQVYDVSADYSTVNNPNGPWSYGWKGAVDSEFARITVAKLFSAENGVPLFTWLLSDTEQPSVSYVLGPGTAVSAAGQFMAEPGTLYFTAGDDNTLHNFGAVRFTVPPGRGGSYLVETSVQDLFDGSFQGDTDFHVARNGDELFGRFLPPHATAGYTNVLALVEGDVIDFLIGRGEDGHQQGSGLKLLARLTSTTNAPPPPPGPATFDLSRDYSLAGNPNGPWSYGYLPELDGAFGLAKASRTFSSDNGVPIAAWELDTYQIPGVWKVLGPDVAHSDGDHFTAEPGTVYFAPGAAGAPQNYGTIRFTVPSGRGGPYRIETSVRSLFDYARSKDADFHVLKNGQELFSEFLPPNSGTRYSNVLALAVGDTIDFAIGRGADGLTADTGLKIWATLTFATNAPPPPPSSNLVFNGSFEVGTVERATVNAPNSTAITGWTVESGSIDYYGLPWVAADGERSLDMNGSAPGSISQEVSGFIVGQRYRLAFLMAGNPYFIPPLPAVKRLRASIGSFAPEYSFDATGHLDSDLGWTRAVLDFTATSPTMTLTFASLTDGSGGAALDAVSIVLVTNPPPPPQQMATHDLMRDYSTNSNPNGVWSFGWKSALGGTFNLFGYHDIIPDEGALIDYWLKDASGPSSVYHNAGQVTLINNGGQGVYPPGIVWFGPGYDQNPDNFSVVRFTTPPDGAGFYRLETAVLPVLNGSLSGDTDFHVLRNGLPLFEQFLPPNSGTGYSNIIVLAAGDAIEFACGRGQDGIAYGSGLKIQARLTLVTNLPPPPPPPNRFYDIARDFSATHNPKGPWSFGYQTRLGGAFSLLTFPLTSFADNAVPVDSWSKNGYEPVAVYHNGTTNTSISDGGAGVFPPGTTWFYPGVEGNVDNFGVIRFTVPEGGAGTYQLQTEVRAYLEGRRSGDTDFHVLRNGVELFGQFVPGNSGTSYSNRLSLVEGDTVDFAVGRGRDDIAFDSGLKIRATFALVTNTPPPPPPVPATFDLSRDYSLAGNPNGPWSYGYLTELDGSFGLARASRTFSSDNGVPIAAWELDTYQIPGVWKVLGPGVAHSDGEHFTAEPGTVYFAPGADSAPQNFGAIRFTLPRGAGGVYRLETAVRSLFDYARSRDSDFHVLRNGQPLFGRFLPPNSGTTYSNIIALMPGDIVDFAIGRGADGLTADTGLKIQATLTLVTNAPPPPPPPGPCAEPAPGIVAWWPAEGNPNDLASTNRGELFGGTTYSAGKAGRAFAFPGDSSGIRIPAGPGLNVGAGPGLTIEGWINPADLSIRGPLVEWNRGGSNIVEWGVHLYILRPDEFGLGEGNLVANLAESNGAPHFVMAPGGTLDANIWQHIALTYDHASGESRLYRNGEVVASANLGVFIPETSYDLYLGRRPAGDAFFSYRGQMDEFAIYNRVLSDTEVHAIAHAGAAGKCRTPAALDALVELVQSIAPPVDSGPLLASLEAVRVSIERGNLLAALRQLEDFQNQVRARLGAVNPALSAQIIALAQFVIETLDPTGDRRHTLAALTGTPLRLERVYRPGGNAWCVEGIGLPGIECRVQRSVDLLNWAHAGFATEADDGRFEFVDPMPPDGPVRFYRLRKP